MDNIQKIVSRIELRLAKCGLTPAAASKAAGLSSSAIYNLKRGASGKIRLKGGNAKTFSALAPVLKTTAAWLTDGIEPQDLEFSPKGNAPLSRKRANRKADPAPENEIDDPVGTSIVKVDGHVGAGAVIYPNFAEVPPEGLFQIELAWSLRHTMVAYEIVGDSMLPRFDPGYVVICYSEGRDPETMISEFVVVRLKDGRRYLKQLLRGTVPGRYNLASFNSSRLIEDVEIDWVGEIHVIVPPRQFGRVNEIR
jgi:phage repressor protein C with HTH and peptisase S24 domain